MPIEDSAAPILDVTGVIVGVVLVFHDVTAKRRNDEALRVSEGRYRELVQCANSAIIRWSRDGTITFFNEYAQEFFGYRADEVIGQDISILVPQRDSSGTEMAGLIQGIVDYPERYIYNVNENECRDGRRVWMAWTNRAVRGKDGQVTEILAVGSDITERRCAQEQQARLAAIVETSQDAILSKDLCGIVQTWNLAAEQMFGYRASEMIGQPVSLLAPPDRPEEMQQILGSATAGERIENFETVRQTKDGNLIDVSVSVAPITDSDGRVTGASTIIRNITDRKRVEVALRKSEERRKVMEAVKMERQRLFDVLEALPAMICLLTPDHVVAFANRSFRERFGEPDGRRCYECYFGDVAPCDFCESYKVLETGQPNHWELHGLKDSIIAAYDFPFTDADGSPMILRMDLDITEQRLAEAALKELNENLERRVAERTEQLAAAKASAEQSRAVAEQANRAKDHFLAVLSHELRTPLTPVALGVSTLQSRSDLPPVAREMLDVIGRNLEMEVHLIDDLLDVSRITRGKIDLQKEQVDVYTVIQRVAEVCRGEIEARHLHFSVNADPDDTAYWVEGDASRLQQVFWNVLKNAIKFTPRDGRVDIYLRRESDHVIVEVKDSGIGLDPDCASRIFDAFEQVEGTMSRKFGGLGLGLAISKALVELHGGQIAAHSDGRDKGTTLCVQLPLAMPGKHVDHSPSRSAPSATTPMRILLVEDHQSTAQMMQLLLEFDGHTVACAGDAGSALQLTDQQDFDLLISDLGLPDTSGYDLLRELRRRGREFPGIAHERLCQ